MQLASNSRARWEPMLGHKVSGMAATPLASHVAPPTHHYEVKSVAGQSGGIGAVNLNLLPLHAAHSQLMG